MSNLYNYREEENSQQFDNLAQTLRQFRNTVDDDIRGGIQQESSMLDALNDNFSQLWQNVRRSSGDLNLVLKRNLNLSRVIGLTLIFFLLVWTIYKLH